MHTRNALRGWNDLLALLSLAAALGLSVALALAGIALLLAAPAYGATAAAKEGTLLLRARGEESSIYAPLLSTDVQFRVTGPIARARVVQTFHNPGDQWYEGVYVFPLPENGAVDRMRLRIGERLIEGEIRERGAARQLYEDARRQGKRSALLDQERPNVFTSRIAHIGPHESVTVELEYQQTLRYDGTRFSLRFPMVIGPRYVSSGPLRVADADRISPPVMRPGTGGERANPVSIRVELEAGVELAEVSSPFHQIEIEAPAPSRRSISLSAGSTPANRDFELTWQPRSGHAPQAAWFAEEMDGKYYGVLMVFPPVPSAAERLPREVIFILDTSGSMAGASIRQAKEALGHALGRLSSFDRFNVIEFNSVARALFGEARAASPDAIRNAVGWVGALEARGGTEMAPALKLALTGEEANERVRQVVFLTDGAVGNEEELFHLIRARLGGSRLFTVGIGSAPNSHFMTNAALLGRGTFTYIGRIDEVGPKMSELFGKLEMPVLKSLAIEWPEGAQAESWPARLPDLYAGEPLVVAVALERLQGQVRLHGERGGRGWEARVPLTAGARGAGMGSLWAREKIAALLDNARRGAPEEETRAQVIELASAHRLVTRYTSFVAVDRTPVRAGDAQLKLAMVPTLLPEGWEATQLPGELPQGSTDSRAALAMGVLALLLALLLRLSRRRLA